MVLPKQTSDVYLFPTERKTPLQTRQSLESGDVPKLKSGRLGVGELPGPRRTNASLSRTAKIDDKLAADQRGHGLGVSLELYSIGDLQQKIGSEAPGIRGDSVMNTRFRRGLERKRSNACFFGSSQLIENMERETGIEPATSSLGNWRTFVNKEQIRPWRSILTIEVNGGSVTYGKSVLNAVIAVIGTVAI